MRNGNYLPSLWNRSADFSELFNDFDKLFGDVAPGRRAADNQLSHFGAADIAEADDHYSISIDVPGYSKEQIKVDVLGDRLTVRAENSTENEKKEKTFHLRERRWGSFERSFQFGDKAKLDGVKARYENGVLSLEVPKKEAAQQRSITIS